MWFFHFLESFTNEMNIVRVLGQSCIWSLAGSYFVLEPFFYISLRFAGKPKPYKRSPIYFTHNMKRKRRLLWLLKGCQHSSLKAQVIHQALLITTPDLLVVLFMLLSREPLLVTNRYRSVTRLIILGWPRQVRWAGNIKFSFDNY